MGVALGPPCEGTMYSLEVNEFVPVEGAMGEQLETKVSPPPKEFASTSEKEYRPATCPLTKNDSKCHADFKEHLEFKTGGFRKGDKFNLRSYNRVAPRPHSSVLPFCGSAGRHPICSSAQPDNPSPSSSSVFLDVSSLRVDAPTYRPAGDSGSFTDTRDLNNEVWQRDPADNSSRSPGSTSGAPPPLSSAAAGEAAPGASNAYAVPRWVEVAWEDRPDAFWEAVEHFFAHGAWPPYSTQSLSVADLCEGQHASPEGPSDGLRGFAPIWVFLLREDDERVFRAAVDFYFECGRFPELTFMPPPFVSMCEGMGIGEFDFYE